MVVMDTTTATTERDAPSLHGTGPHARRPASPAGANRARRRRSVGPDRLTVVLLSVAAFLVVLALLAGQLRSAGAHSATRPVRVLRRVYETTVVETVVGASGGGSSVTQSVSSSGSGSALSSTPATRSS